MAGKAKPTHIKGVASKFDRLVQDVGVAKWFVCSETVLTSGLGPSISLQSCQC